MKTLFIKISLFFLLSFSAFFVLKYITRKKQPKNYNSAFVDKLKLVEANSNKRKIILLGGSSVGWGFSAEQIENKLGIKTINLGHHAGFGLIDFQSFLSKTLTKDDIVIFSPEWHFYAYPESIDKATLDNLIRYNYEYGAIIGNPFHQFKSLFGKIQFLSNKFTEDHMPYVYNCFNKNGDIVSQCNMTGNGPKYFKLDKGPLKIAEFPGYFPFLKTNKTIVAFPPTQQRIYDENKNYLNAVEKSLINNKYTIANNVIDNVYPDSLFFDAEYHITCDTRTRRTEKLINFLKDSLKIHL